MSAASQSKVENIFLDFSFSSRNWGKEFQVSLSFLENGEKNFKFLFLLSIGLFGLSSMTVTDRIQTASRQHPDRIKTTPRLHQESIKTAYRPLGDAP